jgi:hypothetical protein
MKWKRLLSLFLVTGMVISATACSGSKQSMTTGDLGQPKVAEGEKGKAVN